MEKYFSLNDDGRLYLIGKFKSWLEAEAEKLTGTKATKKYKHGSVFTKRTEPLWIFNETEARSWAEFLNNELEPQIKTPPCHKEQADKYPLLPKIELNAPGL